DPARGFGSVRRTADVAHDSQAWRRPDGRRHPPSPPHRGDRLGDQLDGCNPEGSVVLVAGPLAYELPRAPSRRRTRARVARAIRSRRVVEPAGGGCGTPGYARLLSRARRTMGEAPPHRSLVRRWAAGEVRRVDHDRGLVMRE